MQFPPNSRFTLSKNPKILSQRRQKSQHNPPKINELKELDSLP
jgi:hypothetical protein